VRFNPRCCRSQKFAVKNLKGGSFSEKNNTGSLQVGVTLMQTLDYVNAKFCAASGKFGSMSQAVRSPLARCISSVNRCRSGPSSLADDPILG
jgi:hypothetical protein